MPRNSNYKICYVFLLFRIEDGTESLFLFRNCLLVFITHDLVKEFLSRKALGIFILEKHGSFEKEKQNRRNGGRLA